MVHGARRFNTAFTMTLQVATIQFYVFSLRSILILPSNLRLGLPKGLLPLGLPNEMFKALLPSSILAT
jgi:hypothetical protein